MSIGQFQTNQAPNLPYNLEGSRASNKMDWYTVFQIRRSSNGVYKMTLDVDDQSVSIPIKVTNSSSNGNVVTSVVTPVDVNTNGYELLYDDVNRTWNVSRVVGNTPPTNTTIITESATGMQWEAEYDGVKIFITEGSVPFVGNEKYIFSTFATQNMPSGKINEMNTSTQPYNITAPF